ncbi:sensor histidine kinase [Pseudomonas sp. R2.Fl]|nr:sensor histidine kinase [Pseudomonas sp. R2.Fl]
MRPKSITLRLILWLGGVLAAFWLVAASLGVFVMREEFDEIFDSALQQAAERLAPLVLADLADPSTPPAEPPGRAAEDELTYQVRDGGGRVLMRSHDLGDEPIDAPLRQGFAEDANYRYYTVAVDGIFVQVADSLAHRREATEEGATTLLLPIVLLLPAGLLIVWRVVRRAMAPVEAVRAEISTKDGGNLDPVETAGLPAELQPIGASVNLLLSRLRAALDAEREFTANSAHELRTPLAGALAQVQLLRRELADRPEEARAAQIERSLARLASLTEKLLQLSRAEAGIGASPQEVDLMPVLDMVVGDFVRAGARGGAIRYERPDSLALRRFVDPDAFAIVMRNLIENALVHGDGQGPVDIAVDENGTIGVSNGGPVLPAETLAAIRKRFSRATTTSPGSGLGLAIVERLLARMNGRLVLTSPALGRPAGFEARVEI